MNCAACSAALPEDARYCASCGEPVSSVSQMPTGLASPSLARAAAQRPAGSSGRIGRLASSDSIPASGFAPGEILADRYRIIGLLGRGGMGEVYRADDLKLGQPVALKFLPREFGEDPARRDRFYAEVRLARQVSHANVCRVYDVGEVEGQHFLSMEYVDGEDLASLVNRIGRLPHEKALELAREICAGLAAAHKSGVVHRDLKPANVMIDGRGRARITDFGLAVAAEQEGGEGEIAGTPSYMAPEQLSGRAATIRSDIYSMGLVLYELFTGRRAYDASTLAELKRVKARLPQPPSEVAPEIDASVERAISRCLEPDPARRPASALQVSAALPGGDPLAAALAAGETPSPEAVAAAGEFAGLSPRVALLCLAGTLLALLLTILLSDRFLVTGHAFLDEAPEVLAARARDILTRAGAPRGVDSARGFEINEDYLRYVEKSDRSPGRWRNLDSGRPAAILFWYRTSPRDLIPALLLSWRVGPHDPPRNVSGMGFVRLDPRGDLLELQVVPPQVESAAAPSNAGSPDWAPLFSAAGLEMSQFRADASRWVPDDWADARAAWTGTIGGTSPIPVRVEAAGYRGRPVSFRLIGPWMRPQRLESAGAGRTRGEKAVNLFFASMTLLVIVASLLLARRNLRLARADRRGAFRLGLAVVAVLLLSWVADGAHAANIVIFLPFVDRIGFALFGGCILAVLYLALEPLVRRRWPDSLISWTRLLDGQFRDPVVGRDLLIGTLVGVVWTLLSHLDYAASRWLGIPARPNFVFMDALRGFPGAISRVATSLVDRVFLALAFFFLFFLLRAALRKEWLAAAAFIAIMVGVNVVASETPVVDGLTAILIFGSVVLVLIRFGIVAQATVFFVTTLASNFPVTRYLSAWYAPQGFLAVAIVLGLAIYGYRTTLAGRPALAGLLKD
jgi:serine/threonine-protein kinase